VSKYDPPTASIPHAQPTAYDSKLVGVSIDGHVNNSSPTKNEIILTFKDVKKTGVMRYGPGVEQPVFQTRSLETSATLDGSEWAVIGRLPASQELERGYLLIRQPQAKE
jgi:hypothetical protein